MNSVFGIHIGNTNSSIAACKSNGQTETLVDEAGDRVIPSHVTIMTNEETVVGHAAKSAMASKWKTTITSNKSLLGMDQTDADFTDNHYNIPLTLRNNEIYYSISVEEGTKHLTAKDVVAIILRNLLSTAKNSVTSSQKVFKCVLLVPEYFSEYACMKYKTAAESVGWKVLQIIHETAAAILAYSLLDHKEPSQTVLVYRLGGMSCEMGVYELCDGILNTLVTEFINLGGNHFTEKLFEYLADEFYKKYKLDIKENRRSMEKLKLASEKCVQNLTKAHTVHCFVESLHEGVDFSMQVTRARFELLTQGIMGKCLVPLEELLSKLNIQDPVDKLILCGGSTSVPKLKERITQLFDKKTTQILTHINADEVCALGAAKQGFLLMENGMEEFLPRTCQIPILDDADY